MLRSTHDSPFLAGADSQAQEIYKSLKAKIDFASRHRPIRVVMAASAERNEGKTTTLANLAVAYARSGRKAAVIDGNLRDPQMHAIFRLSNHTGLSNVLFGHKKAAEALQAAPYIPNLAILTSGSAAGAADELASGALQEIVEEVKGKFDIVLIDAPQTQGFADPLFISNVCDGIVFVVRAGKTKRAAVSKALAHLKGTGVPVIGAVLNRYNAKEEAAASFIRS